MKKRFFCILLSFSIVLTSVQYVFAGFGGGSRGGSFGTGGFGSGTANTLVSYDVLCQICADINADILAGLYDQLEPFKTHGRSISAYIRVYSSSENPQRYVISCKYSTTTYNFTNNSGGLYFAYADKDNDATGKPFYTLLDTIKTSLANIYSGVTTISTRLNTLLGYVDGIEGYIDGVEGYLSNQATMLSSIVTNTANLSIIATNTGYLSSISSNLIDLSSDDIYIGGWTTFSNGDAYPVLTLNASTFDNLISQINAKYSGRSIGYLDRDSNSTISTRQFLYAYKYNNRIRIAFMSGSTVGNYYLQTLDHHFIARDTDILDEIYTAISNINVNSNTTNTHNTNINLKLQALVDATADIDFALDSLVDNFDINIGSIVDSLDLGFGDVIDSIEAIPGSNISSLIPYVDQLESYSDDVEGLITTNNSKLTTLISSNSDIVAGIIAIQEWLEGSDVLDYQAVSDLIDTWGSSITYTVLNSDNILGLFHSAFGDVPTSIDWAYAKSYFDNFYGGVEND